MKESSRMLLFLLTLIT